MNSHTNYLAHAKPARNQSTVPTSFFLFVTLLAALSVSGCVGLTGAGTPAAKTNSATASSGSLAASATSLAFGNVSTVSSSSQTLTLTNTGTATVTISQASITGAGFSVVGGMTSISIAAGQNHAFQVQFAPPGPGPVTGNISVASDAANSPLSVSLSGTGMTALSITTQPSSQTVTAGQTATFMVAATGSGTLTYQWRKNGTAISGAIGSSYTTPATSTSDSGSSFTVVVTDSSGNVISNSATLTVTTAPVAPSITGQPASQTVIAGQTATFSVTANGTATLSYQWKKNGTAISGATGSSYTTPATQSSDSGSSFSVTITNSLGNITSNAATLTVNVLPSITTQPVSRTVTVGQTATFSVTAAGSGTLTYQWAKNGTVINGATSSSYTTPAAVASDNGASFTVKVTGNAGTVTSNAALLAVNAPPSITTQPASQTVTAGQAATFSVTATGTATLTYQWKKNGTAINGATAASYTSTPTVAGDNGSSFTVTITNSVSSVTSNAATLTVNVLPAITTQPANQSVTAGQTATFTVAATGSGTLSYQWKKNGTVISGATAASYVTPATVTGDSGSSFTVTITSSVGSLTSNAATLTVTAAPVAPSVTTQPASQTVSAGQTATFSVTATGTATLTYQWKKNGTAISGANGASYTTPATVAGDSGSSFTVTVTNRVSNVTSNAATLTVNVPPSITTQPISQTVTAGQTATFTVAATGSGTLSYQWKKNGTAITGATSASYTTPSTVAGDNGSSFTVTVTDSVTNVTSNAAILTVNAPPSITTQPANQTVTAGQTATFSVVATGTATLTYQWKKNGTAITGATGASYTTPATVAGDSGSSFTVTVTNSISNVTSNAATLTVNVPPSITTQPVSQTVTAGQTATFSVVATGSGTLSYQWKKNGTSIGGATAASYTTPATVAGDNGSSITVTVTGNSGSITSNAATLTVNAPPSITTQPASTTVNAGQTASFSVTATGTATLTYQWKKNGTAIGGATSASYTTPATVAGDNGASFTVTVTNGSGNITSNAATLTVTAATLLLNANKTTLSFGSVNLGSASIMSVTFTNAGNASITISGVSISGAGYTAGGVSTGQILTPGQTATLNVTFTPASTGSLPGTASVASNATNSPSAIALSGTGVQPVSHSATLTWTASTSAVSGYNVYRSTISGGPYTKLNSSLITTTSYTDSTVQAGLTYYYVLTSVDSTGVESVFSTQVSATIPTP